MRIHRSLVFHIGTVSRRAMVLAGSSVLVVASLVTTALILQHPQTSYAATPPDTCFAFTAGTGTITDYYDHESNNSANPVCPRAVDIPSTIGGVTVTTIGTGAFASSQLTAVTIPSTVVTISAGGFAYNQLTSVIIPSSVTSLGSNAFADNQLTSVDISIGMVNIGNFSFADNQLTSITIPGSVVTIGTSAFEDNQLTSVTIPDGVTTIGGGAFYGNQLTSVIIPHSVISWNSSSFYNNPLLSSVEISAPTIPAGMFANRSLTSLILHESVVTIDNSAFSGNQLTSITIPNSVTTIGGGAFADNNLTTVTIHGNPTIGGGAFANNGLDKSTIPSSVVPYSAEYYDYYQSNASFVRLYASNLAFLAANEDTLYTDTINSTTYTTSGYLINPASVTVRTVDTNGTDLQPSTLHVSDTYPDYLISSNPGVIASPSTPIASTAYYRAGNTKSFTAPPLTDYILTSSATNSPTLAAGDNTVTFPYAAPVHSVPFATSTVTNYVVASVAPPSSLSSNLITNSTLSIPAASNPCSAISNASLLPVTGTLSSAAPANVLLLGGVNFTLHCTSAAATTIAYTLGGTADTSAVRAYKSNGTTLTDITSDVTITTTNGIPVISYTLQDGGDYDEDGMVNGTIVDPVYVGMVKTASVSGGVLAETGMNVWWEIGGSLVLLGAGAYILVRR